MSSSGAMKIELKNMSLEHPGFDRSRFEAIIQRHGLGEAWAGLRENSKWAYDFQNRQDRRLKGSAPQADCRVALPLNDFVTRDRAYKLRDSTIPITCPPGKRDITRRQARKDDGGSIPPARDTANG